MVKTQIFLSWSIAALNHPGTIAGRVFQCANPHLRAPRHIGTSDHLGGPNYRCSGPHLGTAEYHSRATNHYRQTHHNTQRLAYTNSARSQ